jgi:hypothetical protein
MSHDNNSVRCITLLNIERSNKGLNSHFHRIISHDSTCPNAPPGAAGAAAGEAIVNIEVVVEEDQEVVEEVDIVHRRGRRGRRRRIFWIWGSIWIRRLR